MNQQTNTGSLDQILAFMAAIAASPAFATEVDAYTNELSNNSWTGTITDATGAPVSVSIAETSSAMQSFDWVHNSFEKIITSATFSLEGAYPRLVLLGQRSPNPVASSDQRDWRIFKYMVDAVVMTQRDNAINAEREALLLADAYMSLIDRNNKLGQPGLVFLCEPDGPPAPASMGGQTKAHGVIGGALARYNIEALRQP